MSAIPQLQVDPKRVLMEDGIWRDSVRQPLYSTFGLDNAALPPQCDFFGYGIGANVPGAGNVAGIAATLWHTNMQQGGLLGTPKKFRCTGVRLGLLPLAFTTTANTPELSDPGFGAAAVNDDLLDDVMLCFYSGHVIFRVGEKNYLDRPTFEVPNLLGYDGLCAIAQDNGTGATTGSLSIGLPHGVGIGARFSVYPVLIEDMQPFSVTVRHLWGTPPSLVDDRAYKCYLDGNLWRGVQ